MAVDGEGLGGGREGRLRWFAIVGSGLPLFEKGSP
jgi:hypothetical protein